MPHGPCCGCENPIVLEELAADPAAVADSGQLYTKDVAGSTQLFFMDDAGGITQLTFAGGGALVNGTGAAGAVAFWTGAQTIDNDANFLFDSVNNILSVDTVLVVSGGGIRSAAEIEFHSGGVLTWELTGGGHWIPSGNNQYDIGSDTTTVRNLYLGTQGVGAVGSVGTPSWTFAGALTTGLYYSGTAGFIGVANGIRVENGTAAAPSYSFATATGSGMALAGTGPSIYNAGTLSTTFLANGINIGGDCFVMRDAANTLAQRNSTTAQAFRVYNTFTDSSNYERFEVAHSSGDVHIGQRTAGTGVSHAMVFFTGNTARWTINNSGHLTATDNTYDIGADLANRPRTIYLGTGLFVGPKEAGVVTPDAAIYKAGQANFAVRDTTNNIELALISGTTQTFAGSSSNHQFALITNNTARWAVTTSGHFIGNVDNTYDIGASGATRPRTVYVGTSIVTPIVEFGTNSAQSGVIRFRSGDGLYSRNVAASGDIFIIGVDASDVIVIGNNTAVTLQPSDGNLRINNQTNAAGALTGTLTNSPVTGNPNFWLPVKIAGTTRYIPCF